MKINFTLFNNGQESYCFDTATLPDGDELERFLVAKDQHTDRIFVVPVIQNESMRYAGSALEQFMKTCIGCKHHEVIADPDPHDWFCDDDVAVVCTLKK